MPVEASPCLSASTLGQPTRVFEAVNESLKEFYIGTCASELSLDELRRRHRDGPPASIAHWLASHVVSYRFLEAPSGSRECEAFVRSYALTIACIGWIAITD